MEAGRARHEQRHNELRREDNENPRVNNGLYAPHANPFYRQQRSYDQTSLKWYSTIAVLSGTLAPAGTFLKNTDKICAADCANCADIMQVVLLLCKL